MKRVILILLLSISSIFAAGLTLKSDEISGQLTNEQLYNGFGCSGKNISPELSWQGAPKETKSFAITAYDPDAPTGAGWWHWVVFDIPKDTMSLKRGFGNRDEKTAVQSMTSFGKIGFGGACPPVGDKPHRYIFTLYALDVAKLGLDKDATPSLVGFYLGVHALAKSSIVAYYGR